MMEAGSADVSAGAAALDRDGADPLLRWISTDTELGRIVRRDIMQDGQVVAQPHALHACAHRGVFAAVTMHI
jgi:hypothetical protein